MKKSSFLNEINELRDSYEKTIIESGERFNIFSILNLESNELCHSSFIAELLDPKGKHCFGDSFLKLFINEVEEKLGITLNLNTNNSTVVTELFAGKISEKEDKGGRLDIVVKDNQGVIVVIENKVYASDQKNQLVRYKNWDSNAQIFYLTPYGEDASNFSKSNLKKDQDYFLISYEENILNWLKACVKKVKDKQPYELLINQYLDLVKKLTSNSSEAKLNREIVNLMSENVDETFKIYNDTKNENGLEKYKAFNHSNIYHLKDKLFIKFMDEIEKHCENKEYEFIKKWEGDTDYGFHIIANNKNIKFLFQFGNFEGFYYGFETDEKSNISDNYIKFNNLHWKYWRDNDPSIFGNNEEDWLDISLKENGNTFKRVFKIVEELSLV